MPTDDAEETWFRSETNRVLRALLREPFEASLAAVDELEARALVRVPIARLNAVRQSCADLRLDAALATRQQLDECERLYLAFLESGVDAQAQLMKATILARERGGEAWVLTHLSEALRRAQTEAVPEALLKAAEAALKASE